jgi:protein gp37
MGKGGKGIQHQDTGILRFACGRLGQSGSDKWRTDLFKLIEQTPHLDWLLLTKRPENIAKMLPKAISGLGPWPWPNVWLGATAEDQEHYDRRWKILRRVPAVVHFISYEPAIGPLHLGDNLNFPDWIICGGETGGGARFMKPGWARNLRDECEARGIAFFMKQMTKRAPIPADLMVQQYPR